MPKKALPDTKIVKTLIGTILLALSANTLAMVGQDDRVPVKDPTRGPYAAVGRLIGRIPGNKIKMGTGTLVGPATVLTAAHVAQDAEEFQLQYNGQVAKGGTFKVREVLYSRAFLEAGCDKIRGEFTKAVCKSNDIAFVLLEGGTPVGTPTLGVRPFPETEKEITRVNSFGYGVNAAGYEGLKQHERNCNAFPMFQDTKSEYMFWHLPATEWRKRVKIYVASDCTSKGGDSGSPLISRGSIVGVKIATSQVDTPSWTYLGAEFTDAWYQGALKGASIAIGGQEVQALAREHGLYIGN